MKINTLQDLYVEELRDLHSAETQLVKALPKVAAAATSDELRAAFEDHLEQTREHVERLNQIFEGLGESPKGKKCKAKNVRRKFKAKIQGKNARQKFQDKNSRQKFKAKKVHDKIQGENSRLTIHG